MTDDELLVGLDPREVAIISRALAREAEAVAAEGGTYRKPTWHELWEAGWIEPPYCPWPRPAEASLLRELREAESEFGQGCWTTFSHDADEVLRTLAEREPGLLRHKVTKRDGDMWGLNHKERKP